MTKESCRAGFKLRGNPSNNTTLTQVVVLLAVPPHLKGDSVKISRMGGVWDEMKRTISWMIDKIEPGEAVELHIQLDNGPDGSDEVVRFPVLVRADSVKIYSQVEVLSEFCETSCSPIVAKVNYSRRVIHRKL